MFVFNVFRSIYGANSFVKPLLTPKINNLFQNIPFGSYSTRVPERKGILKVTLIGAGFGVLIGLGYSGYTHFTINKKNAPAFKSNAEPIILTQPPDYKPSRKVFSESDSSNLQLVLFQYESCPFCYKVRAFLDCNRLSYEVVEVDALFRKSLKWSSYKKVPVLLVKMNVGYLQLIDSNTIISVLASYLMDMSQDISEVLKCYPSISVDENKECREEILNKYFLMFRDIPITRSHEKLSSERAWRRWTDEVLVHTLSPNVYRTIDESYQTFNWFADVGKWHEIYPKWECSLMINVGALVMWMIGKKLRRKHGLKKDVRQSLYDECSFWTRSIAANGTQFMGGSEPDLSDISVYGVLSSIRGCDAFNDMINNTRIYIWYSAMEEYIIVARVRLLIDIKIT